MIEIKKVENRNELEKCLKARRISFIEGQGVPEEIEIDERDVVGGACRHYLVLKDKNAIGTFRITKEDGGMHLRRFCMLPEERGNGAGTIVMQLLCDEMKKCGEKTIFFDARCTAKNFYRRCGFDVVSDEFLEAGMLHVKMMRCL